MQSRLCKKCSKLKSLTDFPVALKLTGVRRHECKTCNKRRVEKWHSEHKEERLAKARARYAADPAKFWTPERRKKANERANARFKKYREIVLNPYRAVCACCGEPRARFLTVDHVNNDGHLYRKQHGSGGRTYQWIAKNGFPKDFQVLCMNCNFGKAMNNGICPHLDK